MAKYTENDLFTYLKEGVTQYHLVDRIKRSYKSAGFTEIDIRREFGSLAPGRYFIQPYASCFIAFVVGEDVKAVRVTASHTDFPMLKLKSNPKMMKKGYLAVNTEPYGGLISTTWFDRPLGLAGKIVTKGKSVFHPETELYDSNKPIFIIPSLAPHLRDKNNEGKTDVYKELVPIAGLSEIDIEKELLGEDIVSYDLYLYNTEKPVRLGMDGELIASPRIDNISSAAAQTVAMIQGDISPEVLSIAVYFDNEEIGSTSKQGAGSNLFKNCLERIISAVSDDENVRTRLMNNIFIASLDVAHGLHPNYSEKSDPTNEVKLGEGVVLKNSASQRYVTDSEGSAIILALAEKYNIKVQLHSNKTGMPGGMTLGPIISSYVPAMAVDMGIPILAMHSAYETAAGLDFIESCKLIEAINKEDA